MNNESLNPVQSFNASADGVGSGGYSPSNEGQVASDANPDLNIGENTESADAMRNKAEAFNELINGEYKAEYQSALENALSKRLKTSNKKVAQSEAFKEKLAPFFNELAQRYSVDDPSDIAAIMDAVTNESRNENERVETEFRLQFDNWLEQADEVKEKYPSFDFEYESTNEETGEEFRRLLNSGIDVESAFTVIHKNEIMGGAMRYAYKAAKQEMADARTARLNRPSENGTSSRQASAIIDDITKLRPEQRKLIKAAVSRGEKVSAENFRKFL